VAKKKVKQTEPKAPMTKRELSRWQKQKRQERLAVAFVVGTIVVVAGIILFGVWREIISPPGEAAAQVGSTTITMRDLAGEIVYQARTLDSQIASTQANLRQLQAQAGSDPTASIYVQYLQQQLQQLQLQRYQIGDGQTVLADLIDQALIKQEAMRRGATVTGADVDALIQKEFQPQASLPVTDTTDITSTATVSATSTPAPSPTPIPPDAWKQNYQQNLLSLGVSDADFRRYSIEPYLWRQKLQDMIATTVPTTAEQVHVLDILLPNEAEARDVVTLLKDVPTTSFEEMAKARSTDTATKDKGGDMGWFPRGVQPPEIDSIAFSLQPGQVSDVISTTNGFYVIKLVEKDANRPLDQTQLEQNVMQAFNNWLTQARQSPDVRRYLDSRKLAWLNKQIPPVQ